MNLNNLVDSCLQSEVGEFGLIESTKILTDSRNYYSVFLKQRKYSLPLSPSLSASVLPPLSLHTAFGLAKQRSPYTLAFLNYDLQS